MYMLAVVYIDHLCVFIVVSTKTTKISIFYLCEKSLLHPSVVWCVCVRARACWCDTMMVFFSVLMSCAYTCPVNSYSRKFRYSRFSAHGEHLVDIIHTHVYNHVPLDRIKYVFPTKPIDLNQPLIQTHWSTINQP